MQCYLAARLLSQVCLLYAPFLFLLFFGEEGYRLRHGHTEHVVDVLSGKAHFEHVALEALAVAAVAGQREVCHELHLHRHHAGSLALLAASALGVEGEVLRRDVHLPGQWLLGEELPYGVVGLDVCGGVGACALAYGVLVHHLHVLYNVNIAFE